MLVETFEYQETADLPVEASAEAIQLIEQLGLTGQQELLTPSTDDKPQRRVPYPQATAEQIFVFRMLCPQEYAIKEYKRTPVPLRVLQIAAHASRLEFFEKLVIWDATSAAEKDPVLVGLVKNARWEWQRDIYLLARWGDELEAWPVLLKRALQKKRDQIADLADNALRKVKAITSDGVLLSDAGLVEQGFDWRPEF